MDQIKIICFRCLTCFSILCLLSLFASSFALQKSQELIDEHIAKAKELIGKNKFGEAKKELKDALSLDPNSAMANLVMAVVYRHDGKNKEAIQYVQKALEIQSNNANAHYLMAVLYYETQKSEGAREEVELAINQGAYSANVFKLKGDLEFEKGNRESALSAYTEAIKAAVSNNEKTDELQEKVTALKRYIEYSKANTDNSDYTKPMALNTPMPNYTEIARSSGIQGNIRLSVLVDEKGDVQSCLSLSHLGYGLDNEAIKAARKLKFKPGTYRGTPIKCWVNIEVGFTLR